jgi:hypothetical protein
MPLEQTWPATHAVPHAPQFIGSVRVSTQAPPAHRVSPAFGQSAAASPSAGFVVSLASPRTSAIVASPPSPPSPASGVVL